jgi:hypothetical protein
MVGREVLLLVLVIVVFPLIAQRSSSFDGRKRTARGRFIAF